MVLSARYVWTENTFSYVRNNKLQYWQLKLQAKPNRILLPGVCTLLPYILFRKKFSNFAWTVFQQSHGIRKFFISIGLISKLQRRVHLSWKYVTLSLVEDKQSISWFEVHTSAETQDVWTRSDEQPTYMSFTECNSGTIENLPFAVNTMTELKQLKTTSNNTGTLVSRNILC